MTDFYVQVGRVALGSRLRRLAERLSEEAARIYEHYGVALEPRWFPVLVTLSRAPGLSTTEIASAIGHSRPSVSQILADMKRRGLVETRTSEKDARATVNVLTAAGRALLAPLEAQCDDVRAIMEDLASETEHDLWPALADVEAALDRAGLFERVAARRRAREAAAVEIRPYRDEDAPAFAALNRAWIERHFTIEPEDLKTLSDPRAAVLDRGGRILMATSGGEAVGACALIPKDGLTLELAKMAVAPRLQGLGLGRKLGEAAIAAAREMGARRIYLETNSKLVAALHLYEALGFRPAPPSASPYTRCDVQMELPLD